MTARNSTAARPTARQLAYLASLVERAGLTQEQWRESVGLYEASPWGRRLRAEMITRTSVSAWIDQLKGGLSNG